MVRQPLKSKIERSWAAAPKNFESTVSFLNWFDGTSSVEDSVQNGQSDWENRLANFSNFKDIDKNTCLEIGFGGGRLLAAASKHFDSVIGIDIHEAFDKTENFLKSQNVNNYDLMHRNDIEDVEDKSIDFIYSFITFQHFDSFEEIDFYLKQIKRVLTPEGYAHVFWGKLNATAMQGFSPRLPDSRYFFNPQPANNRDSTLFVGSELFCEHLISLGFNVVEREDKMPKRINEPVSPTNESGQSRALFKIP
jgi:SAM-dependent methyltransferase